MSKKQTINLGDLVRDRMTGFEGIAVAQTQWLYGCRRITVQPKELKDGKLAESSTFDEMQLEIVKAAAFAAVKEPIVATSAASVGGPRPEPQRGR